MPSLNRHRRRAASPLPTLRRLVAASALMVAGASHAGDVGATSRSSAEPLNGSPTAAASKAAAGRDRTQGPLKPDLSGRRRVGKASFYAGHFVGRKMADGTRMDPHQDNAASKTLPLGTKARITNLETGQSAVVTIKDRGPYVKDRIVDLTPATASKVGLTPKEGVAPVVVAPITVPQPDGSVKLGDAVKGDASGVGVSALTASKP